MPCCDTLPPRIEHASSAPAWDIANLQTLLIHDMGGSPSLPAFRESSSISPICCILHNDTLGRQTDHANMLFSAALS